MNKSFILFLIIIILASCKTDVAKEVNEIKIPSDLQSIGLLLDSINIQDQKYRDELDGISEKYGWNSKEMMKHWDKIRVVDRSNLRVVEKILSDHGWLSSEQIGSTANSTLFLVIQHADQKSQEKYLPMMREAVKNGMAESRSLALLEDRVALGKGELQIYGSQIGTDQKTGELFVLPLMDPETVNERRAEVGLGPIEDYISRWDLEWDLEAYKKELPELIKDLKESTPNKS